jgi:MSHA biogenesis protein MshM
LPISDCASRRSASRPTPAFSSPAAAVSRRSTNGEGFIKITGEVGTGKTMLCRKFLATLDENTWVSAYIPNPNLEPRALLFAVAEELGLGVDPSLDQYRLLKSVTLSLLDMARNRRRVVLCMDESQAMPLDTLEALRLMTNLETEKRKLLQVVLFGQPELDRKLASESVRQLRQRITFQHDMQMLEEDEVGAYFTHRMRTAGYAGPELLTGGARRPRRKEETAPCATGCSRAAARRGSR